MYYGNPAPLSDFLPTPEEKEAIRLAIFRSLYNSGAYTIHPDIFLEALTNELGRLGFLSNHQIKAVRASDDDILSNINHTVELHDALEDASYHLADDILGIGHKLIQFDYEEPQDDDPDWIGDSDYFLS